MLVRVCKIVNSECVFHSHIITIYELQSAYFYLKGRTCTREKDLQRKGQRKGDLGDRGDEIRDILGRRKETDFHPNPFLFVNGTWSYLENKVLY